MTILWVYSNGKLVFYIIPLVFNQGNKEILKLLTLCMQPLPLNTALKNTGLQLRIL